MQILQLAPCLDGCRWFLMLSAMAAIYEARILQLAPCLDGCRWFLMLSAMAAIYEAAVVGF